MCESIERDSSPKYWFGLVRNIHTGKVIFRYLFPDRLYADGIKLCMAYGLPIGDAFGTHVEVWLCAERGCVRFYPADVASINDACIHLGIAGMLIKESVTKT